jgi:hypothetical protein
MKVDDESSEDNNTNAAFLEMLGLPLSTDLHSIATATVDENTTDTDTKNNTDDNIVIPQENTNNNTDENIDDSSKRIPQNCSVIALPHSCARYSSTNCSARLIPNLVSPHECAFLIHACHNFRYITQAVHVAPDQSRHMIQLANPNPHQLDVIYNPPLVARLWRRLQPYLNKNTTDAIGLNPKLRILKYNGKDHFAPHFDAITTVGPYTSRQTVLLYLNSCGIDFDGGETIFLSTNSSNDASSYTNKIITTSSSCSRGADQTVVLVPTTGTVVLFDHDLYHSGTPLLWGTKYVLRTDVLYATPSTTVSKETACNDDNQQPGDVVILSSLFGANTCSWLNDTDRRALMELGVWESTAQSFLAVPMVRQLLQEHLTTSTMVDRIIETATRAVAQGLVEEGHDENRDREGGQ